jgi:RNA polymerase sigma-70 factor (ECF subfamily)
MHDRTPDPDLDRDFATFCRTADPTALGRAFDASAGHVFRIALWLCGNRADAEDAVQRTFLVAIEQRARFRTGHPALPWLLGLLTNQVHKVRRERARRGVPIALPAGEPDPAVRVAGAELEQALFELVRGLGPSYHDVLELHLHQGLAATEIAQRLGRPAGTVRTQIVRGVQELRRRLPSGFAGGLAPAAFVGEPLRLAAAVRETVLAAARAPAAAIAGGAWTTARATLLVTAGAMAVIGIALATWLPGRAAVTPAEVAAAGNGVRGAGADDDTASTAPNVRTPLRDAGETEHAMPLERAAVAGAALDTGKALRIRVCDAAGSPLQGARVWLCNSTWVETAPAEQPAFVAARTDALGLASFGEPRPELDTVVVHTNGGCPVQVARNTAANQQEVVVDQRLSITGAVLVDGHAPGEPIALVAVGDARTDDWCAAAVEALSPFDPNKAAAATTCDRSGAFVFFGLAAGAEYSIQTLERIYRRPGTRNDQATAKATPVAAGLVLELETVPLIRGRVVASSDTAPTPGRRVWIHPWFHRPNGGRAQWTSVSCRIGDAFAIPVWETDLSMTTLQFRFARSSKAPVAATRAVDCPFGSVFELGDIAIDASQTTCEWLVVDRDGAPIPGACVIAPDDSRSLADHDGHVVMALAPLTTQVLVGATGYRVHRLDVTPSAQAQRIVLESANRLHVEARAAEGFPALPAMRVDISYGADAPFRDFDDCDLRGARLMATSAGSDYLRHHYLLGAAGVLDLCDFVAEVPFTVVLCDAYGHEVAKESVILSAEEHRHVRFAVARSPRHIAGTVIDSEHRPLAGVTVWFGRSDLGCVVTDENGGFWIEGVYCDAPSLEFAIEGFQTLCAKGPEVFEQSAFRLERGE